MQSKSMETLQQLNEVISEKQDKPALVALVGDKQDSWTYGQLSDAAEALARGLIESGLRKGSRVALIGDNSPSWIISCLAVMRAGGICVPIDAQFSDEQLRHVLEDSEPEWAFVSGPLPNRIQSPNLKSPPCCVLLDGDEGEKRHWSRLKSEKDKEFPKVSAEEVAVIFFTSGTTGPPKGVPLTHANLLHQLEVLRELNLVGKDDRLLLPLPLHHVYPFTVGMLAPLTLGVPLVFPGGLTGKQIRRALKGQDITIIIGLPRLYRALLEGIDSRLKPLAWLARIGVKAAIKLCTVLRRDIGLRLGRILLFPLHQQFAPHLKILISGGAALAPEMATRLEGFGWKLGMGYGLTETSPLLTVIPPGKKHWDSVGKPVKKVEIRIAEAREREGGRLQFGEVQAKGPNIFGGYLNNPEKTAEAFTEDGWFRTGDRGTIDRQGYLHLAGRLSTLIVTESGENIQPDQVEEAYERHPAIRDIGVLERNGRLVAVVVPEAAEVSADVRSDLADALLDTARKLPSYQHLSGFEIGPEALPRTRLGKIRRDKLKEIYEQLRKGEAAEAPQAGPVPWEEIPEKDRELLANDAAQKIWEMLAQRYPEKRLAPDTHLALDLGIDSLEWLNITLEIEDRCGPSLTEEQIGNIETVRDLLKTVVKAGPREGKAKKIDPLEEPESVLTEGQRRWLEPSSFGMHMLAWIGYSLNRLLFKSYFHLEVEGGNPIDIGKPCLITPNHFSYLDPCAIAAALDNKTLLGLRWAGWAEIMLSNPLMRLVARNAQVVPVDPRGGAASSLAFGAAVLKRGEPLIWFPEGKRSRTGKLQRFQPGIGILAAHFKIPIIPVYIEGSHKAMPPGENWPRSVPIRIRFGTPLESAWLEERGEGDKPYKRIIEALHRHMAEHIGPEHGGKW